MARAQGKFVVMALLLGGMPGIGSAFMWPQAQPIDVEHSSFTIHVGKAGLFSPFGHDHTVRAPIASGEVDRGKAQVALAVKSASLVVADPGESESTRAEVQKTMLGPEVLDVQRYPEIRFQSTRVEKRDGNSWQVTGELELHGARRPITFTVKESGGAFTGSAIVKQRDFGITPVTAGGGTVKVKNEVMVEFEVKLSK
ncbi:MAG TPA: YceI family protein [Terriglobales bacterium]|nr:YceI family protein [Terriglobales bacterium]